MSLIVKKAVISTVVAVAGLGASVAVFAQTPTNNATKGTLNSDVTASTTTGASSTMAGHHMRKPKHKSASSAAAASQ